MIEPTLEQLKRWDVTQRHLYKKGILSKLRIKKLETIPGWQWEIYGEEKTIKEFYAIIKRSKEKGRKPKQNSEDKQEKKDASWISFRKGAKIGKYKGEIIWYPSLEEIAKRNVFPDIFNTKNLKEENIKKAYEIFGRAKKRGSLPKFNSKDLQERKDAAWISNKKGAKFGKYKKQIMWDIKIEEIAKQFGFGDVFNKKLEEIQIEKCHEIFKKAKIKGHLPDLNSKDPQESKDARWIFNRKQAKLGKLKKEILFYPIFEKIVQKYGFPNAFNTKSRK